MHDKVALAPPSEARHAETPQHLPLARPRHLAIGGHPELSAIQVAQRPTKPAERLEQRDLPLRREIVALPLKVAVALLPQHETHNPRLQ